jgi:hypothetical protein
MHWELEHFLLGVLGAVILEMVMLGVVILEAVILGVIKLE